MKRGRKAGFTMIELLIVVAIIGILAGMAIINYRQGLQRAKQRRTMSDMRAIATSWEARTTDVRGYNAAGFTIPDSVLTLAEVDGLLSPTYTKSPIHIDGWGRNFEFTMDQPVGGETASVYAIRSAGSDLTFEGTDYTVGTTSKFDCDIVYSNGSFITSPATQ